MASAAAHAPARLLVDATGSSLGGTLFQKMYLATARQGEGLANDVPLRIPIRPAMLPRPGSDQFPHAIVKQCHRFRVVAYAKESAHSLKWLGTAHHFFSAVVLPLGSVPMPVGSVSATGFWLTKS